MSNGQNALARQKNHDYDEFKVQNTGPDQRMISSIVHSARNLRCE